MSENIGIEKTVLRTRISHIGLEALICKRNLKYHLIEVFICFYKSSFFFSCFWCQTSCLLKNPEKKTKQKACKTILKNPLNGILYIVHGSGSRSLDLKHLWKKPGILGSGIPFGTFLADEF